MNSDIEVIQDLRVFGVEEYGDELRVDVFGSIDCVCGTLIYRIPDASERAERALLLTQWYQDSIPVTYVRREQTGALVDERSLLEDALRG